MRSERRAAKSRFGVSNPCARKKAQGCDPEICFPALIAKSGSFAFAQDDSVGATAGPSTAVAFATSAQNDRSDLSCAVQAVRA